MNDDELSDIETVRLWIQAIEEYCGGLVAALEWYAVDERYRGHDPEILYDVGYVARNALDGDSS